jgi:hypothetical protein
MSESCVAAQHHDQLGLSLDEQWILRRLWPIVRIVRRITT